MQQMDLSLQRNVKTRVFGVLGDFAVVGAIIVLKLRVSMKSWTNVATLRLKTIMMRRRKDDHEENKVEALLKPIQNLEPNSDYDSDVSEISDVFEEFHKNSYLKPQSKRYLTKIEADIKTMNDFTDDFKATMSSVREASAMESHGLFLENTNDIEKIFEQLKNSETFPRISIKKSVMDMLEDNSCAIPPLTDLCRKDSGTSSGSMVWHMLAANSENHRFQVSPPGYDTFRQKQKHWLQRESVSWNEIEKATSKCEQWLQEQCH